MIIEDTWIQYRKGNNCLNVARGTYVKISDKAASIIYPFHFVVLDEAHISKTRAVKLKTRLQQTNLVKLFCLSCIHFETSLDVFSVFEQKRLNSNYYNI